MLSKSKLAQVSLVFVVIAYPMLFLVKFFDLAGFNSLAMPMLFLIPLVMGSVLGVLSFVFSIVALIFIKKNNLLGKKTSII